MTKLELKDIIKRLVKDTFKNKSQESTPEEKLPIKTQVSKFDLIVKFPELINVLVSLMTNDFELFLKDIFWVAPKPTTFKIMLINGQHFFLIYSERSWIAQIEGKKYYLLELRDAELAAEAISRILKYGKISSSSPSSLAPEKSTEETPAETPTTEETPPAEETPAV
jgi:hypothetical protein